MNFKSTYRHSSYNAVLLHHGIPSNAVFSEKKRKRKKKKEKEINGLLLVVHFAQKVDFGS